MFGPVYLYKVSMYIYIFPGCWPLIGWKIGDERMCILECNDSDTGGIIDWGVSMGKLIVVCFAINYQIWCPIKIIMMYIEYHIHKFCI